MSCFYHAGNLEYWDEEDSDLDADFSTSNVANEPPTPPQDHDAPSDESLSPDEQAVYWYLLVSFKHCTLFHLELSHGYFSYWGSLLAIILVKLPILLMLSLQHCTRGLNT